MAQLMPLPLTVSCFSKIQIGSTFLVLANLGSPGKRAVKRVCVCVGAQSKRELDRQVAEINASRPQCPVGLNTLVLPSKNTITDSESDKTPYVYLHCGHVHGQHSWGKGVDLNNCTCPMCLKVRAIYLSTA